MTNPDEKGNKDQISDHKKIGLNDYKKMQKDNNIKDPYSINNQNQEKCEEERITINTNVNLAIVKIIGPIANESCFTMDQ